MKKIALIVTLVMVLSLFAGCKSSGGDSINELVDTNGIAGSVIDIEIPQGGNNATDETPDNETPDTETPDTETPDTETPDNETPDAETPDAETPDGETPNGETPDGETPDGEENYEDLFKEEDPDAGKPAYDESKKLTVVSYNIKCAWYGKTYDQIVKQLQAVDPDIIGFQEVDHISNRSKKDDQIAILAQKMGYNYYYFEPVISLDNTKEKYPESQTTNLYGHAVLSRYPITKSELIWPKAQSEKGEPRNFGRHEIDVNGTKVVLYNCHLDGTVGREQYREVQDEYMSKDEYAICTGDFNETFDEFAALFDWDNFYNVSWGHDDTGNEQSKRPSGQVIDHIIVTKDKFVWKKEEGEAKNGRYVTPHDGASDHNMIYSYLNLIK